MLNSYKQILLISFFVPSILFSQDQDKPLKIDTKIKDDAEQKKTTVFSVEDNSTKFKIDPAEVNKIKSMDAQAVKEKIEMMRDKVLDSKSRLMEVSKQDLATEAPLSYISIAHRNRMSSRFHIMSLKYILDGKNIYSFYESGEIERKDYSVYSSFLAPGHHEVLVEAVVSGSASGVFEYLKDYKIKVQDRFTFVVPDKKKITISGISYENGSIFTSFKDRPAIKFESAVESRIAERIEK